MKRRRLLLSFAAGLALGTIAAAADAGRTIVLPPFLVEEAAKPLPWRYADVAGLEVLSSCADKFTRELIANHHRLHALLAELLPPALQWRTTEKRTLIFVDSAHQPPTSQEVAQMLLTSVDLPAQDNSAVPLDDGRLRRRPPPPRYTFLPNLRLWDRDAQVLFAIVKQSEFDANRVALTPEYVGYLLQNRLPALPPWFVSGVLTMYARAKVDADALTFEPLDWLSASGSAALLGGAAANRALLPFADFFAGTAGPTETVSGDGGPSLWQAQAALVVHWGIGGRGAPRRAAFWRFVERAATESVTEALFKECFGIDFAAAHAQMTAYLPDAMRERLTLRPAQRPRLPDYALRAASEAEIARLKGDWERLEIGFVKAQFPALTTKYVEQARRTLLRAYDRGNRDPRLLAVLGLCEVDAGNDAAAREYLEAAVAGNQGLRARAGYELARLRLAALGGAQSNGQRRLTPQQANDVLTPLLATREQEPPLAEVYVLLADVWAASVQPPTRPQLDLLAEGVRLFPRHSDLVYGTAELNLRHGSTDAARWQISLGMTLAPDDATRSRFAALQEKINARP